MPRPPEQPPRPEAQPFPFFFASRFESRETSQQPYDTIQGMLRDEKSATDFSVFRLLQNWPESKSKAPPSTKRWYVVVLGNPPREPFFTQVTQAINTGEPVAIPDELVEMLVARRIEQAAKGPFREIHRTFTMRRKKDKEKNKQQKQSRRRNRGT